MKAKYLLIAALFVCMGWTAEAQQLPLTNFYTENPFVFNPANAGKNGALEGYLNYRKQWAGFEGAPKTLGVSANTAVGRRVGLGLNVLSDNADRIQRLSGTFSYAYHLPVGDESKLSFGVSAGFYQNSFDWSNINIENTSDPIQGSNLKGTAYSANFGLLFYRNKWDIGIAIPNLFDNSLRFSGNEETFKYFNLSRHYSVLAGYNIQAGEKFEIRPSVMVRTTDVNDAQIDGMATFTYNKMIWAGFGWRQEAGLLAKVGLNFSNAVVGYSYEFSSTGIASYANGSHEFFVGIRLNKKTENVAEAIDREQAIMQDVKEDMEKESAPVIKDVIPEITYKVIEDTSATITETATASAPVKEEIVKTEKQIRKELKKEKKEIKKEEKKATATEVKREVAKTEVVKKESDSRFLNSTTNSTARKTKTAPEEALITSEDAGSYVILESQRTEKSAKAALDALTKAGYKVKVVKSTSGKWYYLALDSSKKGKELQKEMSSIRKKDKKRKLAWIYTKK